jgi:hypothetical protein
MNKRMLYIMLTFGSGLAMAMLWVLEAQYLPASAAPPGENAQTANSPDDELHVCPSGCPYSSIQEAVDAAAGTYPIIKVAAGEYTDVHVRPRHDNTTTGVVTQVVYITKSLAIEGGYSTSNWTTPYPEINLTMLNARGQGRVFYIAGDIHPTIEGLRVTGGDAAGMGGEKTNPTDCGGGIYIWKALATIKNNRVFANTAESGGGIYAGDPNFSLNKPGPLLEGNTIISNTADSGGGLFLSLSTANVNDNVVHSNDASIKGGGIKSLFGAPTIQRNIIHANNASSGGGGYFQWGDPTIVNNAFIDNHIAGGEGSGLRNEGSTMRLLHNTFARNTGGDGSGVYVIDLEFGLPTVWMTNTILVNQPVGIHANGTSTVTVTGILWYDVPVHVTSSPSAVMTLQHEYSGNPTFAPDGYHITVGSVARDNGVAAGVTQDIDGESRPSEAGFELGADEYWPKNIYLPIIVRG